MAGQEAHQQNMSNFSAYYLQQLTQELSDDIDKLRAADDFKPESVSFLVHALRQGASQFLIEDRSVTVPGNHSQQTSNN